MELRYGKTERGFNGRTGSVIFKHDPRCRYYKNNGSIECENEGCTNTVDLNGWHDAKKRTCKKCKHEKKMAAQKKRYKKKEPRDCRYCGKKLPSAMKKDCDATCRKAYLKLLST